MTHGIQKSAAKSKPTGKAHVTFRASGPIRAIIANEMRSDKNKTRVIEKLIAAGAKVKYPKLVERFNILQEEAA